MTTPSVSPRSLLGGARPTISGTTAWGLEKYTDQIIGGGFPGMQSLPAPARRALLDGYVERIVDRDFPETGRAVRNPKHFLAYPALAASLLDVDAETLLDGRAGGPG